MNDDRVSAIVNYINDRQLCVLGTVTADSKPRSATMYVVSDPDLNVYFLTKKGTLKYQNIMDNHSVSFTLQDEDGLTTLQMHGEAYPMTPAVDSKTVYELFISIRAKIEDYRLPISKIDAGEYEIFKTQIDHALLTEYKQGDITEGVSRIEFVR